MSLPSAYERLLQNQLRRWRRPEPVSDTIPSSELSGDQDIDPPPTQADLCSQTGRRLSYPRAEYLFKQATKPLDPEGNGYTLRQLKPAADS